MRRRCIHPRRQRREAKRSWNSAVAALASAKSKIEGSECALRDVDPPLIGGPVDHARGILALQHCPRREMRIIEGTHTGRSLSTLALNVDVMRLVVPDAQHARRLIEHEAGLIEILAPSERLAICGDELRNEIEAKNIRGLRIEGGIGNGAFAVAIFVTTELEPSRWDSSAGAHSGTAQKASIILRGPSANSSVNHHCARNGAWASRDRP